MLQSPFSVDVQPDWQGLRDCILRKGTPERVHHIELFIDWEVQQEICRRYGLLEGLHEDAPDFLCKRQIRLQRFLGYDYVRQGLDNLGAKLNRISAEDTAELARSGGRDFMNEHKGPITNWQEFEDYPWPDPEAATTNMLECYEQNLPEDMCVIGSGGFAHFAEWLTWLMGYETLCYALYDQRDLVKAISDRLMEIFQVSLRRMLEFDCVKIVWGPDDMGFKTGTLISPHDLREFVLPGHKLMARMAHDAGLPYLLHSCGKLDDIMDDLLDDVKIDALHSFEDSIEPVAESCEKYGDRIALLGGIDMDFLARADEEQIRRRVRRTLKQCLPGGGYCLGSGNSIANYIPVDNYLAMLDEGRKFDPSSDL
ncbi:MAG: uroporphyrinogen-III decarboxylase-like protein [Planctomycetes bacterium]|nr:uroporphyrinogen-III decarboxylase-like protein [Planctomycetota bacterium]